MRVRVSELAWDGVELLETVVAAAYLLILLPVVWFVLVFSRRKETR